jgi:hypothetical protein
MNPSIKFLKQMPRGLTQVKKKVEEPPPEVVATPMVKEEGIITTRLQPLRFKKK